MTDHIADLLVRIRNASMVRKYEVELPFSKMKEAILTILEREGFVKNIEVIEEDKKKNIKFRISSTKLPTHVKQISKPGQRIYTKSKDIPNPLRGFGLVIISTPKGVITAKEATKLGLGGELICEIW
ncbi:MAG: 30S ribosomal protein S8 [Patescibacteria group bacterium]